MSDIAEQRTSSPDTDHSNAHEQETVSTDNSAAQRKILEKQILADQETTLELMQKFDSVKNQAEQMEADNRYMQAYIGELVAQTRATGPTSGSHSAR